jgi:hypothetical protein
MACFDYAVEYALLIGFVRDNLYFKIYMQNDRIIQTPPILIDGDMLGIKTGCS